MPFAQAKPAEGKKKERKKEKKSWIRTTEISWSVRLGVSRRWAVSPLAIHVDIFTFKEKKKGQGGGRGDLSGSIWHHFLWRLIFSFRNLRTLCGSILHSTRVWGQLRVLQKSWRRSRPTWSRDVVRKSNSWRRSSKVGVGTARIFCVSFLFCTARILPSFPSSSPLIKRLTDSLTLTPVLYVTVDTVLIRLKCTECYTQSNEYIKFIKFWWVCQPFMHPL